MPGGDWWMMPSRRPVKQLIERSSLGTPAAMRMRRRTPGKVTQRIVAASTRGARAAMKPSPRH
jgi:hypothetical protein